MKKFSLFSLVVLTALLSGCSKDELQAPAATGEGLTPRSPECTPQRFPVHDVFIYDFPEWYWPCIEEPISLQFVGYWDGHYTTSASCVTVGTFKQKFQATGVGLESGHSYRWYGQDHWRDKYGEYNSEQSSAVFFSLTGRFTIVNETTGQVYRNVSISWDLLINGNGEVVMNNFQDFNCD